jgi:hypothetical protein
MAGSTIMARNPSGGSSKRGQKREKRKGSVHYLSVSTSTSNTRHQAKSLEPLLMGFSAWQRLLPVDPLQALQHTSHICFQCNLLVVLLLLVALLTLAFASWTRISVVVSATVVTIHDYLLDVQR